MVQILYLTIIICTIVCSELYANCIPSLSIPSVGERQIISQLSY